MIHVEGDLNVGNYLDQSVTIGKQENTQNNTQFCSKSIVKGMPQGHTSSDDTTSARVIRFSGKRGMKIDLYRVILALLENGFFTDVNGAKPTQKEVFEAFSQMLHADFSDFQKNLSQSRLCNNDSDAPTRIFDLLKVTIEEYYQNQ